VKYIMASADIVIAAPGSAADYESIKELIVEYAESLEFSLTYTGDLRNRYRLYGAGPLAWSIASECGQGGGSVLQSIATNRGPT